MPPMHVVVLHRWQVVLAFVAIVVAFVGQGVVLTHTISDVNHDRIVSCKRTYEGVREIFRPFFPARQTAKQRRDIARFNHRVDELKARCDIQVGQG